MNSTFVQYAGRVKKVVYNYGNQREKCELVISDYNKKQRRIRGNFGQALRAAKVGAGSEILVTDWLVDNINSPLCITVRGVDIYYK